MTKTTKALNGYKTASTDVELSNAVEDGDARAEKTELVVSWEETSECTETGLHTEPSGPCRDRQADEQQPHCARWCTRHLERVSIE